MNEQYFTSLNGYYVKDKEAIHTYDSVAEMKTDSKIKEGSYVKTRGYYNVNDGGNGDYIIRTKNQDDVEDNGSIHFVQNNLVAELIVKDNINVKQFGAKGDGITDDTELIQLAFNKINKYNIYIPSGKYKISEPINVTLRSYCEILLENDAEIFTENNIDTLINLYGNSSYAILNGGIYNANNNANYCIKSNSDYNKFDTTYKNILFKNAKLCNLQIRDENHIGTSEHGFIINCKINNNITMCTGINLYANDYTIDNCEIYYTNKGILLAGILMLTNSHIWAGGNNNSNDDTIGVECLLQGGTLMVDNCYFDGIRNCILSNSAKRITLTNSFCLFPLEGTFKNNVGIIIQNSNLGNTNISNVTVSSAKATINLIELYDLDVANLRNENHNINNTVIRYTDNFIPDNEIICYGNNINIINEQFKKIYNGYSQELENKYYKIGYIILRNSSQTSYNINAYSDNIAAYDQVIRGVINQGDMTFTQDTSTFNSLSQVRFSLALGVSEQLTTPSGIIVNACPIYLHIKDNVGNQFGMNISCKKIGTSFISINNKFVNTPYTNPSLLKEWPSL